MISCRALPYRDYVSFVLMADCEWYALVYVDGIWAKLDLRPTDAESRKSLDMH